MSRSPTHLLQVSRYTAFRRLKAAPASLPTITRPRKGFLPSLAPDMYALFDNVWKEENNSKIY